MVTVFLSLPKSLVFVALRLPSLKNSKAAKYGKVIAISVVVIITSTSPPKLLISILLTKPRKVFASVWIRKKIAIATKEIEAEHGISQGDEELSMLTPQRDGTATDDTSYNRVATPVTLFPPYQGTAGSASYQHQHPIPRDEGNTSYAPYRAGAVVQSKPLEQETGVVR